MGLSVVVITKNEQSSIERCLDSVKWADEIIVLDAGSEDRTCELARQYTELVFETDWPGFGKQKNRAIDKATQQWILSVDADEQLSPLLQQQIKAIVTNPTTAEVGFRIPFHNYLWGNRVRFGRWSGETRPVLFRRGQGRFSDVVVHESVQLAAGPTRMLSGHINHFTCDDPAEMLEKINRYSTISAEKRFAQGIKSSVTKAIVHGGWAFFIGYVLRGGFLDGRIGLVLAAANATEAFWKHVKLATLCQQACLESVETG